MNRHRVLFGTAAVFNWLVAIGFASTTSPIWSLIGLAPPEQTLFLHFFVLFVVLFGCTYFWIALDPTNKRGLILIAVIGKLAAFAVVFADYVSSSVPFLLVVLASGDVVFAVLFLRSLRPRAIA